MRTRWTGVGTALVTPFTTSGDLDEKVVRGLGRRQIDAGIHFLVPCGTTGENPTLTLEERVRIVEILVDEARGQVPVLAGAGGYNTREIIHLASEMLKAGASGLLSVAPYYNKPTQEGLYRHFRAIADSTPLPVVLYNVVLSDLSDQGVADEDVVDQFLASPIFAAEALGFGDAWGQMPQPLRVTWRMCECPGRPS